MHDPSNAAVGMLPPPRIPSRPRWPSVAAVATVAGDKLAAPIADAQAAQERAAAAVNDVERHRPGPLGSAWREALDADAADYAAGRTPTKWRAADLLEGDPQRWATARVLCGAVPAAWRKADQSLDRSKIHVAATQVAEEISRRFAAVARDGWAARENPHRAWPLRGQGEELIGEYKAAQALVDWAAGGSYDPAAVGLPGGPEAAGHWLCLDMALNPKKKMLGIPRDVVWPEGADRLLGMAIPAGRGFTELRRDGFHEVSEVV